MTYEDILECLKKLQECLNNNNCNEVKNKCLEKLELKLILIEKKLNKKIKEKDKEIIIYKILEKIKKVKKIDVELNKKDIKETLDNFIKKIENEIEQSQNNEIKQNKNNKIETETELKT